MSVPSIVISIKLVKRLPAAKILTINYDSLTGLFAFWYNLAL